MESIDSFMFWVVLFMGLLLVSLAVHMMFEKPDPKKPYEDHMDEADDCDEDKDDDRYFNG